jgi:histidyl-tRNA synthetase
MIDPRVASGLRDLLPSAAIPRERILRTFRDTFARFGFLPIETPHIERMEVLTGKGAGSDEVLRQIFEVTNRGGTPGELALRFDLTVPLARFIARHVDSLGIPFKRYAIGSVFRGERPAKGRFREFTQCDFDTVGSESPIADAETLQVVIHALLAAGVPAFTVAVNHRGLLEGVLQTIGAPPERHQAILRILDKRDKIGLEAVIQELTQPKTEGESPLLEPDPTDRLLRFVTTGRGGREVIESARDQLVETPVIQSALRSLSQILDLLSAANLPPDSVQIDTGLARGLDYYTGMVFETTVNGWERFGSIASGGRYDNLASLYTSRRLPGVGGSIGLDRLLALLEEAGQLQASSTTAPVLVVQFPGIDPAIPFAAAARLRAAGLGAEIYPDPISLGKQLGYGSSRGHTLAVIIGPDEASNHVFNLRTLATRAEVKNLPLAELETRVSAALNP